MESACREKQVLSGKAPGIFRRPDLYRGPLKNYLLAYWLYCLYVEKSLRRNVPITASGPQGEQPLPNMINVGKGSRQIRPVTLGKGLALVLRGNRGDVVCRWDGVLFC